MKRMTVLIADDDPVILMILRQNLEPAGFEVHHAANGPEALQRLVTSAYDLAYLDIHLPEMDGLEATQRIRKEFPTYMQPCIIAMTANAMSEDRAICLAAGMNGYVGKPFEMEALRAVLRKCLLRRGGLAELEVDPLGSERAPGGRVDGL